MLPSFCFIPQATYASKIAEILQKSNPHRLTSSCHNLTVDGSEILYHLRYVDYPMISRIFIHPNGGGDRRISNEPSTVGGMFFGRPLRLLMPSQFDQLFFHLILRTAESGNPRFFFAACWFTFCSRI